jgi:hypothetical protein
MSGENILVAWPSLITIESGGLALASGVLSVAGASPYNIIDGGYYPDAQFILTCNFATAPVDKSVLVLVAQELDIDGTLDTLPPTASRLDRTIGNFVVAGVTGSRSMSLVAYDIPPNAAYYIYNNATGQALAAGWTLKVRPRTIKAAA